MTFPHNIAMSVVLQCHVRQQHRGHMVYMTKDSLNYHVSATLELITGLICMMLFRGKIDILQLDTLSRSAVSHLADNVGGGGRNCVY
jgi:hypothetical protein